MSVSRFSSRTRAAVPLSASSTLNCSSSSTSTISMRTMASSSTTRMVAVVLDIVTVLEKGVG
ncbi:hypothetical protein D3C81_1978660 [compost metagenome]